MVPVMVGVTRKEAEMGDDVENDGWGAGDGRGDGWGAGAGRGDENGGGDW